MAHKRTQTALRTQFEAVILAGGESTRMGREKSVLRLGGCTLLSRIRKVCQRTSMPDRVLRHDLIPHCGPLSGVFTALTTSAADGVLFLSCDMPFVTPQLLERIVRRARSTRRAVFSEDAEGVGFPFLLWRRQLAAVEDQIASGRRALQLLAGRLRAGRLRSRHQEAWERFNVNTPEDLKESRRLWKIHADPKDRGASSREATRPTTVSQRRARS